MHFLGDKIGEFLNGARDGAIYISFGSILQGSQMSEDRRRLFLNVFRLEKVQLASTKLGQLALFKVLFNYKSNVHSLYPTTNQILNRQLRIGIQN